MQTIILIFFNTFFLGVSLQLKFCVNCKFAINNMDLDKYNNNKFMKCSRFPIINENNKQCLVTNISEENYNYCSIARKFNDMCGEEGKMYKKKYIKKKKS